MTRRVRMVSVAALSVIVAMCATTNAAVAASRKTTAKAAVTRAATRLVKADSVAYTATIEMQGISIVAHARAALDPPRVVMTLDGASLGLPAGSRIEARVLGDAMFLNFGGILPSATRWVKIDLGALTGGADVFGSLGSSDSFGGFAALSGASGVTKVGTEKVDGTTTTHYHATIDPDRVLRKVPSRLRDAVESFLAGGALELDAWVGNDGHLVRLVEVIQTGVAADNATMKVTIDLDGVGVPVDVKAPPADQVTDITSSVVGVVSPLTSS